MELELELSVNWRRDCKKTSKKITAETLSAYHMGNLPEKLLQSLLKWRAWPKGTG